MKKFKCDCKFHIVDIDITPIHGEEYIGMTIYNHISVNTGKKLKKPIELGTVVLIGKEARAFKKYINGESK
jgi:hypothetical protein